MSQCRSRTHQSPRCMATPHVDSSSRLTTVLYGNRGPGSGPVVWRRGGRGVVVRTALPSRHPRRLSCLESRERDTLGPVWEWSLLPREHCQVSSYATLPSVVDATRLAAAEYRLSCSLGDSAVTRGAFNNVHSRHRCHNGVAGVACVVSAFGATPSGFSVCGTTCLPDLSPLSGRVCPGCSRVGSDAPRESLLPLLPRRARWTTAAGSGREESGRDPGSHHHRGAQTRVRGGGGSEGRRKRFDGLMVLV